MFLHPDGAVEGSVEVEPETYYLRLGQLLIKLLDQRTDDGFAYRVDMRLRPVRQPAGRSPWGSRRSKRTWSSTAAIGSDTRTSKRGC